jgi:prepilin-type N-terminal cleavage/methylation domain-containing protein
VRRISLLRIAERLRGERGFGLVELLVAMAILSIGLFALLGTFTNGYRILTRASTKGAASVLADSAMESYRGMQYNAIPYCPVGPPQPCSSQSTARVGPDGRTYQVTTVVSTATATNTDFNGSGTCDSNPPGPPPCHRTVKVIEVTVTDSNGRRWASERSTFDPLTGLSS